MSELTGEYGGKRGKYSPDTTGSGFVAARGEKCWSRPDHYRGDMYRLFIVIGEGLDGERVARAVYATSEDDARQAHQENYAGETVLAVQQ
jgi:hypothetical protein